MLLTGAEPASAAASAVANAHNDVEIRTDAQHSYAELLTAQRGLSEGLFAAQGPATNSGAVGNTGEETQTGPGVPGVPGETEGGIDAGLAVVVTFLETDMAGNAVRVGIDPGLAPDVGPLGTVSELTFKQSKAVVAKLLDDHIEVPFTVADGRGIAPAESFQGGETMQAIRSCTWGFTARRSNGSGYDYGIITAGHCGNDLPIETVRFSMHGVELPFVYGWLSATTDAQFHSIPAPTSGSHHVLDDYLCRDARSYPNPSCDVTGTIARADMTVARDDMPGDFVCHTGKSSGISCGEITNINHQLRWANAPCRDSAGAIVECGHVFVKVEGQQLRGCGGDSGGPVYRGGKAYGITAATTNKSDCVSGDKLVVFSGIREVESFLSVEVLTQPVTLNAP